MIVNGVLLELGLEFLRLIKSQKHSRSPQPLNLPVEMFRTVFTVLNPAMKREGECDLDILNKISRGYSLFESTYAFNSFLPNNI